MPTHDAISPRTWP